ncbi:hypothetical protein [Kineosporia sp. NBRC 101731]|uniref:hypothetical protein n=1 Tax=Kineosporia sp. NBRC 101731 TaxID=3032199 RepID=UPI0024A5B12A|nr:hypothetical protein [Kineosporia sp. NBRC 101731]GLY32300.1 hypothetical protein Kisp02_56650 [Kineosporia sp. NBRC 101731]
MTQHPGLRGSTPDGGHAHGPVPGAGWPGTTKTREKWLGRFQRGLLGSLVIVVMLAYFVVRDHRAVSESSVCAALTREEVVSAVGGRAGYDEWSADRCRYGANRVPSSPDLIIVATGGSGSKSPETETVAQMKARVQSGDWSREPGLGDYAIVGNFSNEVQVKDDGVFFSITVTGVDHLAIPYRRDVLIELARSALDVG